MSKLELSKTMELHVILLRKTFVCWACAQSVMTSGTLLKTKVSNRFGHHVLVQESVEFFQELSIAA